jgi:SAM-dependent methyltransferase
MSRSAKEWSSPQNALAYLNVADSLPHRSEGESVLIEHLPEGTKRILDLGTGDGRLIKLIKANRPEIEAVAIDVSPTMLRSANQWGNRLVQNVGEYKNEYRHGGGEESRGKCYHKVSRKTLVLLKHIINEPQEFPLEATLVS